MFIIQARFIARQKRQGWERLGTGGAPQACRGGGATSRKPRPPRMQGKSGPPGHLSGQPGGCLGVAASIKYSHQVLFFLPITALTILAIATAMTSDGRLCSRQK